MVELRRDNSVTHEHQLTTDLLIGLVLARRHSELIRVLELGSSTGRSNPGPRAVLDQSSLDQRHLLEKTIIVANRAQAKLFELRGYVFSGLLVPGATGIATAQFVRGQVFDMCAQICGLNRGCD